ncbi:MAG: hypothetical protein ABID84_03940 [Chloroflexota bacterium]
MNSTPLIELLGESDLFQGLERGHTEKIAGLDAVAQEPEGARVLGPGYGCVSRVGSLNHARGSTPRL